MNQSVGSGSLVDGGKTWEYVKYSNQDIWKESTGLGDMVMGSSPSTVVYKILDILDNQHKNAKARKYPCEELWGFKSTRTFDLPSRFNSVKGSPTVEGLVSRSIRSIWMMLDLA